MTEQHKDVLANYCRVEDEHGIGINATKFNAFTEGYTLAEQHYKALLRKTVERLEVAKTLLAELKQSLQTPFEG